MPTIEIIVNPQGASQVRTSAFSGTACRKASHLLEQSLGTVSHEHLTAEFHQSPANETQTSTEHGS